MNTGKSYEVTEVGYCIPGMVPSKELKAGEVGYVCASIKRVADARVGDTITHTDKPTDKPLKGYKKAQSMVYCGVYPAERREIREYQRCSGETPGKRCGVPV